MYEYIQFYQLELIQYLIAINLNNMDFVIMDMIVIDYRIMFMFMMYIVMMLRFILTFFYICIVFC
jgi:hypothetical protein